MTKQKTTTKLAIALVTLAVASFANAQGTTDNTNSYGSGGTFGSSSLPTTIGSGSASGTTTAAPSPSPTPGFNYGVGSGSTTPGNFGVSGDSSLPAGTGAIGTGSGASGTSSGTTSFPSPTTEPSSDSGM